MVSLQQLCTRYTGVWEGSSLSNSGDPTTWSNTLLIFRPRVDRRFPRDAPPSAVAEGKHDGRGGGNDGADDDGGGDDDFGDGYYDAATTMVAVEGRGVSCWRDMRIFFLVSGDVDLATGRFALRKQHTGAYTNRVEYHGELDLRPDARKGPPFKDPGAIWTMNVVVIVKKSRSLARSGAFWCQNARVNATFSQ